MFGPLLPLIAATAIATASVNIVHPSVIRVQMRGAEVRTTTTGAPPPDHVLKIERDPRARTCTITYVLY